MLAYTSVHPLRTGLGAAYRGIVKPLLFRCDPEAVHDAFTRVGEVLGGFALGRALTSGLFGYAHPMLKTDIGGMRFANPVGLAAGFDKNARLTRILPCVGFGFAEVGSVTGEACGGNPKPRLWRLPEAQSLVVYYGLMNDGADAVATRLASRAPHAFPVGVSVAKTNSPATVDEAAGITDYVRAYRAALPVADYVTINISCPNAFGGEPFSNPEKLERLLTAIDAAGRTKPVFLKMPADLSPEEADALVAVGQRYNVAGYVCTNLTKRRDNPLLAGLSVPAQGGISGKAVAPCADAVIARVYRRVRGSGAVVVGCGGIFTAEDAYRKIRLGASLLQLITGMIYQGPQLIGDINRGLVSLLRRDGFSGIAKAVGADVKAA